MVKVTAKIDGMMCGMCETHVNDAIRNNFQVEKVNSSHKKGETVIVSETDIDEAKLAEVIGETGYKVLSVSSEPYKKRILFG